MRGVESEGGSVHITFTGDMGVRIGRLGDMGVRIGRFGGREEALGFGVGKI